MECWYRIVEIEGQGFLGFVATERGLRRVYLPERSRAAIQSAVQRDFRNGVEDQELLPELAAALLRYFAGEPADFAVRFDWSGQSCFDIDAWNACRRIGYGRTATYGELAERIGRPGGARAIGMAMSHNPCPIVVPCHRVVKSDGSLGGYSGPGGVDFKRRLLALEAAAETVSV